MHFMWQVAKFVGAIYGKGAFMSLCMGSLRSAQARYFNEDCAMEMQCRQKVTDSEVSIVNSSWEVTKQSNYIYV